MPHTVSFIQDEKDPSVQHEFLVNVGPLCIKEEEPDENRSALRDRSFAMLKHPPAAPTAATDAASASALPWMDAILAHVDVGPIVLASVDAKALLALRRLGRQGKEAVKRVWCLRTTRLGLLRETKTLEGQYACPYDVMRRFAERGELHAMQLARLPGHDVPWNEWATAWAAFYGRTDMIYWMRFEADPPVPMGSKSTYGSTLGIECRYAAKAGRLDVLDWLRKHGFVMTNDACCEAAREGHLHVVKRICCVADPYATWWKALIKEVIHNITQCRGRPPNNPTASLKWHASLKHRLEYYMPLLEWYMPFTTKSEREQLGRYIPGYQEWFKKTC